MSEILQKNKYIECMVDRFEGEIVVLRTTDGQVLEWKKNNLPSDIGEGDQIKLVMTTAKSEQEDKEETVKAVLNEILKIE